MKFEIGKTYTFRNYSTEESLYLRKGDEKTCEKVDSLFGATEIIFDGDSADGEDN
jgi:hypothetical protein